MHKPAELPTVCSVYRMPRPRGKALGRAPRAPRVAYRFVDEPRVVPLVVPLVGPEYFDVGLEETVLGGCSTKEVSVVLARQLISILLNYN